MIGLVICAVVVGALLIDEGEVVTLHTRGDDGSSYDTQLWLVESEGALFVRATSAGSDWLARLRAHPEVTLERGEEAARFRAQIQDDPSVLAQVNRAMALKYGRSERWLARFVAPSRSVAVRLDWLGPVEEPTGSSGHP